LAQSVAPGTSTLSICWQAQRLLYFHTFDIRHIHISKGKRVKIVDFRPVFALFIGLSILFFVAMGMRTKIRFRNINLEYGKPYTAEVIKIVKVTGNASPLQMGTISLAFHPKGAISFDTITIKYSQIEAIYVSKSLEHFTEYSSVLENELHAHNDRLQHSEAEPIKFIWLSFIDVHGKNQIAFTAKKVDSVANELFKCWRRYQITGY